MGSSDDCPVHHRRPVHRRQFRGGWRSTGRYGADWAYRAHGGNRSNWANWCCVVRHWAHRANRSQWHARRPNGAVWSCGADWAYRAYRSSRRPHRTHWACWTHGAVWPYRNDWGDRGHGRGVFCHWADRTDWSGGVYSVPSRRYRCVNGDSLGHSPRRPPNCRPRRDGLHDPAGGPQCPSGHGRHSGVGGISHYRQCGQNDGGHHGPRHP